MAAGDREWGAGDRKWGAGDRKWGAGDREKAAGDQKGPGRNFLRDGPEKTGTEPGRRGRANRG